MTRTRIRTDTGAEARNAYGFVELTAIYMLESMNGTYFVSSPCHCPNVFVTRAVETCPFVAVSRPRGERYVLIHRDVSEMTIAVG